MQNQLYGVVAHPNSSRPTDYLFRVSIKNIIRNSKGDVLAVKESGRDWWDLPGGGIDHEESIHDGIARELAEEVSLTGNFTYKIITAEDPCLLKHGFYQIRLIAELIPENFTFSPGIDADEVAFLNPQSLKNSAKDQERKIYQYSRIC